MTPPRRIGLLGGTFDPVHIAHLHIAACAMHDLRLDEVRFVPAGMPPHKPDRPVTPAPLRFEMLELAIAGISRFQVDPIDLAEDTPSYTSDLLARIRELHRDDELWFIIGGDSLRDFAGWHEPGRIISLARLAVAARPGVDTGEVIGTSPVPGLASRVDTFSSVPVDISSTLIRERLGTNKPVDWLVPADVLQYIHERELYR